ncbi:hypothetical protein AVEN_74323-1 [Araneus ventricosus]|uniref:Uncharacterized protein n=1 Tax=Araneus ventricosus TaxID=182803 RepID=A0A4Y2HNV1_ARAVE|nr:hypothetical protein AVEN_74323-1 [Araneus ventricosus]
MEEVFLRFGLPRKVISDDGTQSVSAVMQQMCYPLKIHQSFIPLYYSEANPVEIEKRDLKSHLTILVEDQHDSCEFSTVDEVQDDLRSVFLKDIFVPEITPYMKRFSKFMAEAKEVAEMQQDSRKECGDRKRRRAPN